MRVRIKHGWEDAGRIGTVLRELKGPDGIGWTVLVWDDDEDPTTFKTRGLEPIPKSDCTVFVLMRNVHYEFGEVVSIHETRVGAEKAANNYPGAKPDGKGGWEMSCGTEDLQIHERPIEK